jgi:hypothetical protein
MLKIEARATEANKQNKVASNTQNYPQSLWIKSVVV